MSDDYPDLFIGGSIHPRTPVSRASLILGLTAGPFAEDEWIGKRICIGESVIAQIIDRIPRCRVVTHDPTEINKYESKASLRRLSVALVGENNLICKGPTKRGLSVERCAYFLSVRGLAFAALATLYCST